MPPATKSWLVPFTAICYSLLLPASLAAAGFAFAEYDEGRSSFAYHNAPTEWWGMVGEVVGSVSVLCCIIAILFLFTRNKAMWTASLLSSLAALAGCPVWILAGLGQVSDAKQHGGDWAGSHVVSSMVFGVGIPAILGLMVMTGLICLLRQRPGSSAGLA